MRGGVVPVPPVAEDGRGPGHQLRPGVRALELVDSPVQKALGPAAGKIVQAGFVAAGT